MKLKLIFLYVTALSPFSIPALPIDGYEHTIFHSTKDTLATIMDIICRQEKGAYLRFGDGDCYLATGGGDMLQKKNDRIKLEMQEAFALDGPTILKSLPIHCREFGTYEKGMTPGNYDNSADWCLGLMNRIKPYWQPEMSDIYSSVALQYAACQHLTQCISFLQFLKNSNCCLLVGNREIPQKIRELLFGENCQFVPTPPKRSYRDIDKIEAQCLEILSEHTAYKIVITAMGCAGRVLQKRLWYKVDNIFLFDFGSLMDVLCGWDTRAWITYSKINHKEFVQLLCKEMNITLPPSLIPDKLQRFYY
jgi:hypothetical protein